MLQLNAELTIPKLGNVGIIFMYGPYNVSWERYDKRGEAQGAGKLVTGNKDGLLFSSIRR